MPLRFLLDEHFRGLMFRHIQRYNLRHPLKIDVVRIGDSSDLPLGTDDRSILRWAEQHDRLLVSLDGSTLPTHLSTHLSEGHHSPGILLVRHVPFAEVVEFLALAAHASDPAEWADRITFIP